MKRGSTIRLACLMTCCTLFAFAAAAETTTPPLPSFEIFGFTPEIEAEILQKPYDIEKEIKDLDQAIKHTGASHFQKDLSPEQRAGTRSRFYVPILLTHLRPLYLQQKWTPEQRNLIEKTAAFLARDFANPELALPVTDDVSARLALDTLRVWFLKYADEGDNLARLMFTFDEGPFHGTLVAPGEVFKMKRIGTRSIPDRAANFAVWRDKRPGIPERIVIGVVGYDQKLICAQWLSDGSTGVAKEFEFTDAKIIAFKDFGYLVSGKAGWRHTRIYLNRNLGLRFVFLSTS